MGWSCKVDYDRTVGRITEATGFKASIPDPKGSFRIAEKDCLRKSKGGCTTVCDVNRCLLEVNKQGEKDESTVMLEGLNKIFDLARKGLIEILEFKDRLNNPTSGG